MFLRGTKSRNAMVDASLCPFFFASLLALAETDEQAAAHPDTANALFRTTRSTGADRLQANLRNGYRTVRHMEYFPTYVRTNRKAISALPQRIST